VKQLVILSGKGGTGKTTVAAALAHLASQKTVVVIADADVDAPNLGLLLAPQIEETTSFVAGQHAIIDASRCTGCGRCAEVCRFDAVIPQDGIYRIDVACEGCATCFYQCPAEAIAMQPGQAGRWFRSTTRFGPFFHAHLYPGEENSGKLVSAVRQAAMMHAQQEGADWLIVDGPPGIGCPVIAAVTGADLALMVAEPTVSGVHDLRRALEVADHFGVTSAVCVNKSDINISMADEIRDWCRERDIPVLVDLPYDEAVVQAMRRGLAITELPDGDMAGRLADLWAAIFALGT